MDGSSERARFSPLHRPRRTGILAYAGRAHLGSKSHRKLRAPSPEPAIASEVLSLPDFAHERGARSNHEKVSAAIPETPHWSNRNRQHWLDNQPLRATRTTASPRCISRVSCHPAESSQPRSKETCRNPVCFGIEAIAT